MVDVFIGTPGNYNSENDLNKSSVMILPITGRLVKAATMPGK